jgi:hypothetical protein
MPEIKQEYIPAPSVSTLEDMANSKGKKLSVPRSKTFSRKDVVNAFNDAFHLIGGVQALALWAGEHPTDFYKLYARLLPTSASSQLEHSGEIKLVHVLPRTSLDE